MAEGDTKETVDVAVVDEIVRELELEDARAAACARSSVRAAWRCARMSRCDGCSTVEATCIESVVEEFEVEVGGSEDDVVVDDDLDVEIR